MADQHMTVSVVIPVHNGMPFLPETLATVFAQTRQPDEIVVVENGSTDGTAEWLMEHDDRRVRVVVQDSLVGPAENWTRATAEATGDLVKLVCADDLLDSTALDDQSRAFERHPDAVLVASLRRIVDESGATIASRRGLGPLRGHLPGKQVLRACALRGQNLLGEPASVMFRHDALLGTLPWDDSLPYVIDLDMYSRVLPLGAAVLLPEVHAQFRVSNNSWSASLSAVQHQQFDRWLDRTLDRHTLVLTPLELRRARLMSTLQAQLRQAAYHVVDLRRRARRIAATS